MAERACMTCMIVAQEHDAASAFSMGLVAGAAWSPDTIGETMLCEEHKAAFKLTALGFLQALARVGATDG